MSKMTKLAAHINKYTCAASSFTYNKARCIGQRFLKNTVQYSKELSMCNIELEHCNMHVM